MSTRTADLRALMAGFTRCLPAMAPPVQQAINAYAARRVWPRYYLSPSYLAHDGAYWWGAVYGCVVILKRKWVMGHPVLYAPLPPLPLPETELSLNAEIEATTLLLSLGIGVKHSEEDVQDLAGDFECCLGPAIPQKGNVEYIYDLRAVAAAQGGRYHRLRSACNAYARYSATGQLDCYTVYPDAKEQNDVHGLAQKWRVAHKWRGAANQARDAVIGGALATLFYDQGKLTAFSLSEQLTMGWYTGALALRTGAPDSHFPRNGDMVFWQDAYIRTAIADAWYPPGTPLYYNFGSAVNSHGLIAHKDELGPFKLLQIYDIKPRAPITAEEWKAAVPGLQAQAVLL